MRKHHELSPSSFGVWDICPHFTSSEKEYKETTNGIEEHMVLETLLKEGLPDNLNNIEKPLWAYKFIKDNTDIIKEIEEPIDINVDKWNFFGTPDCIGIEAETLKVFDYKSGVPFKTLEYHKKQLSAYALGVMQKYKTEDCICAILYGGNKTDITFYITKKEAEEEIKKILYKRENKDLLPKEKNHYCKYCKYYEECNKVNDMIINIINMDNEEIINLPEEEILGFFNFVENINNKANQVKELIKENLQNGKISYENIFIKTISSRSSVDIPSFKEFVQKNNIDLKTILDYIKVSNKDAVKITGLKEKELKDVGIIKEGEPTQRLVIERR